MGLTLASAACSSAALCGTPPSLFTGRCRRQPGSVGYSSTGARQTTKKGLTVRPGRQAGRRAAVGETASLQLPHPRIFATACDATEEAERRRNHVITPGQSPNNRNFGMPAYKKIRKIVGGSCLPTAPHRTAAHHNSRTTEKCAPRAAILKGQG